MKTVDFLETIVACDRKIGRFKQLDEVIKVYEYYIKIKTCFSQKPLDLF